MIGLGPDEARASRARRVVVPVVSEGAVVLGSTQPTSLVTNRGPAVMRRRSGGGAVYVSPGDPVWVDAWIPRDDLLWQADVGRASWWVGEWWATALASLGLDDLDVHRGPMRASRWSSLVCFAGVGPGELLSGRRKVVGVAQWRAREGSLFHSAAYLRWEPRLLAEALDLGVDPESALSALTAAAAGLDDLLDVAVSRQDVLAALFAALPAGEWETETR